MVAQGEYLSTSMKVISRRLETMVRVLDHHKQLAMYFRNGDDNIIAAGDWVFDPVSESKARSLLDEFLDRPFGLCAITSIRYNGDLVVQQALNEIERERQ